MDKTYFDSLEYSAFVEGAVMKRKLSAVISPSDIWKTKDGITVIGLVGIQKIADYEGIVEKKFTTDVTPTEGNKQQHVINIWVGLKKDNDPDNWKRGSGEASQLNTGRLVEEKSARRYEEYNYIDSKYRYAMADKRAFCRAMLKFIRLNGVYSEVEAKEFLAGKPKGDEGSEGDYDY